MSETKFLMMKIAGNMTKKWNFPIYKLPKYHLISHRSLQLTRMGSTLGLEAALTAHLVAIPFPGRGHINPMINFCKMLATKQPHFLITLIVTEEWLGFLSSETKPPDNIQFQTIPNVIPSELVRAADHPGFIKATSTEMKAPVELVIEGLQPKPVVILYDPFLTWGLSIQGNIPTAAFWPMSATAFSMVLHYHLLCQNRHLPLLNLSGQFRTCAHCLTSSFHTLLLLVQVLLSSTCSYMRYI